MQSSLCQLLYSTDFGDCIFFRFKRVHIDVGNVKNLNKTRWHLRSAEIPLNRQLGDKYLERTASQRNVRVQAGVLLMMATWFLAPELRACCMRSVVDL